MDGQRNQFFTEVKRTIVFCPFVLIVKLSSQLLSAPARMPASVACAEFLGDIHLPLSKAITDSFKPAALANFVCGGCCGRRHTLVKFGLAYCVQQRTQRHQSEFFVVDR